MFERAARRLGQRLGREMIAPTYDDWHQFPDRSMELAPTWNDWHQEPPFWTDLQVQDDQQVRFQQLQRDYNDMFRTLNDPNYGGCTCLSCQAKRH
jgi:hypothetical protein